jgi:hypothetical protein
MLFSSENVRCINRGKERRKHNNSPAYRRKATPKHPKAAPQMMKQNYTCQTVTRIALLHHQNTKTEKNQALQQHTKHSAAEKTPPTAWQNSEPQVHKRQQLAATSTVPSGVSRTLAQGVQKNL